MKTGTQAGGESWKNGRVKSLLLRQEVHLGFTRVWFDDRGDSSLRTFMPNILSLRVE